VTLTFGSLFAGIGGMDLGLERAGMQCRWQVEIDDYATKVLAKHWPTVPRFRDVRDVGAGCLERVDLIAGGFPCQDISVAGKGAGIAGKRSWLWAEYARIIGELRPRFVLVENVPALRSRGLGRVLGDLASLGYDAEWDCIPAAAVGAPHLRDRIWIVAYASGSRDRALAGSVYGDARADRAKNDQQPGRDGEALAYAHGERRQKFHAPAKPGWAGLLTGPIDPRWDQWGVEPGVGRVAHGIPRRLDQLRGLGNAVVPQVVEWIGRRIVAHSEYPIGPVAIITNPPNGGA